MSPALLLIAALGAAPQGELLDFTATWCSPCQQMNPVVERLRREGLPIRQIDVDQHRDLVQRFKVEGIPAFVLVVNGQEVDRAVGGQSEARLRQMLAKIPSSAAAPSAESAPKRRRWFEGMLGKGEPAPEQPPEFDSGTVSRGQTPSEQPQPPPASTNANPAVPTAGKPLQTAVRIRVTNEKGTDFGSGTLIGSRNGAALVLTCWHIFREFGETADVAVDLFPDGPTGEPQTFHGKLLRHDESADVALVVVTGCGVLPVSPLAATDQFPKPGDHVFSVGCGDGKAPTKEQHAVTRLNPYQGPGTTECTGMPVVGRSGGGLFDSEGRVIGVCFAADRADRRGVYVGTAEIHELLVDANYGALIPAPQEQPIVVADVTEPPSGSTGAETTPADVESNPFAETSGTIPHTNSTDLTAPRPEPAVDAVAPAVVETPPAKLPAAIETALAAGTAMEATIILRPIGDPKAPSEVIVINRISDPFRRYLKGEVGTKPVETALHVPLRSLDRSRLVTADLMVVASSETYIRSVASKPTRATVGVALLARVFNNHR
ncbi:MAG: trypsin-like peptidase domain-containing protein [Planctomycetaceae bacterium]